ncbi:5557_t:CDS:2 [Entrophospora sp. SA101]|nr:5557_t:CDS:2 [Entrophospora sp. SA101]
MPFITASCIGKHIFKALLLLSYNVQKLRIKITGKIERSFSNRHDDDNNENTNSLVITNAVIGYRSHGTVCSKVTFKGNKNTTTSWALIPLYCIGTFHDLKENGTCTLAFLHYLDVGKLLLFYYKFLTKSFEKW